MKKFDSPQEKKLLSYKKDRRNTYGERGSHSRHAIAAHKERDRRAFRRKINQTLNEVELNEADFLEIVESEIKSVRIRYWKKCPDQPLGEVVTRKLLRRKSNGINETMKKTLVSKD
jgi:hypothetical protein